MLRAAIASQELQTDWESEDAEYYEEERVLTPSSDDRFYGINEYGESVAVHDAYAGGHREARCINGSPVEEARKGDVG
tara:strand:- start:242 stop:475 length:234 start_codon:yes stop_codon:yes gene_type:complete